MRIHREGYYYILIATLLWIGLGLLVNHYLIDWIWIALPLQIIFFLLWFWVLWFFRLPSRVLSAGDELIVAPADGKVVVIEETEETEFFKDRRLQVSIFMSPLNVHVNRAPISGSVDYVAYHPGKFLVAWHPKSSTENERTTIVISNPHTTLLLRQIAGAVARRICYYVKAKDAIRQNEEFGFIKFGSRVDIFFPIGTKIDVKIGEKVQGGVTVLARIQK